MLSTSIKTREVVPATNVKGGGGGGGSAQIIQFDMHNAYSSILLGSDRFACKAFKNRPTTIKETKLKSPIHVPSLDQYV
jgi:formyltetrahydrofolate synthetase